MKNKIPSFFEIFQSLIKIPSISSYKKSLDISNKKIINLLANYFEDLEFSVKIYKIPNTNNKYNLLASKNIHSGGILFSGHTDTVSFDTTLWNSDPFKLIKKNNKYYGLGVVDMKGFLSCILETLKYVNFKKLKKSIYILASADEETTMSGAKYFASKTTIKPDCIILGEPTLLVPIISHKGHISLSIIAQGVSGHSSNPYSGINSIEIINEIIFYLIKLRNFLKYNYSHKNFSINHPTLNLGSIYGGNSTNCICSICTLNIDIRNTPNITIRKIFQLINFFLKPVMNKWPNKISIHNIHEPIPSYSCIDKKSVIHKIEKISKKSSTYVNYCTEASFLQKIAPTIILGPGSIDQAHKHNEFIDISQLLLTKNLFLKLICEFCLK